MSKIQSKQINKLQSALVKITGVTVSSANSVDITTPVTSAVSTAGDAGKAVPLQTASVAGTTQGFYVAAPHNLVHVFDNTTGAKLDDGGNEVFGRLTESAGVYTVSFYTNVAGTETPATINTDVSLLIAYQFNFETLPRTANIQIESHSAHDDVKSGGSYVFEKLTVSATNTIPNLSSTPINANKVKLSVNGQSLYAVDHFTVTGQAITISAGQTTNIGYDIETTDIVFAEYFA
ncbi:hypothetical protein [Francisella philomiragia]|uniref:Uncharacterized protein n=1 Tax=Francisella philomiragia TaxID=28110 RepID=A0ABS1GD70_9GAMM|nr:hypothetical protein [Francisella philomiragia]MBK2259004.1 hypothetical protein [Francisella philomiragia]MBK2302695.1 hypothetical protein [Francisella philomiragia]